MGHTGEAPLLGVGVAVADTTRLHPDADLPRSRFRSLPLAKLERTAGLGYLNDSHRAQLENVRAHYPHSLVRRGRERVSPS